MVMEPVPSYGDLIWLFEAEPVYQYADDEGTAGHVRCGIESGSAGGSRRGLRVAG